MATDIRQRRMVAGSSSTEKFQMKNISPSAGRQFYTYALLSIILLLIFRNSSLYPAVFADEYGYSMHARLLPLSESTIPGYVYLLIYRFTNVCGDNYLQCTRLLNTIFFVSAAPFIYAVARRYCGKNFAVLVSILAILGPTNVYTAFFMPEPLYFLMFWVFTWQALRLTDQSSASHWITSGALLALASLVKPHALLFIPGVLLYLLFLTRTRGLRVALSACLWFLASMLFFKFALGYLLAGRSGITLMGPTYTSMASEAAQSSSAAARMSHYEALIVAAITSLKGHIEALALLSAMPVAALVTRFLGMPKAGDTEPSRRLTVYSFAVLLNLLCVTALFTASVAGAGPYETITRLHSRYYNFALPLLYIVACSELNRETTRISTLRFAIAVLLSAVTAYCVAVRFAPFTPSYVDGPEIRGITRVGVQFVIVGVLSVSSALLWAARPRLGALAFLVIVGPVLTIGSYANLNMDLHMRSMTDYFDHAGLFVRDNLSRADRDHLVVIGEDPAALFRTLFYVDSPAASLITLPPHTEFDLANLPFDTEWLLTLESGVKGGDNLYQMKMPGFTLYRLPQDRKIRFSDGTWPSFIDEVTGLSSAEQWGIWSDGKQVTFKFASPLPAHVKLRLWAKTYGPNVGQNFVARIGDQMSSFSLDNDVKQKQLELDNPHGLDSITFVVPKPTSPSELGQGNDPRKLGMGLVGMEIE
jgi:phosphoglycerol transferase